MASSRRASRSGGRSRARRGAARCVPTKHDAGREHVARAHEEVSIACLALYFSSRLVGSQIICLAVFITE